MPQFAPMVTIGATMEEPLPPSTLVRSVRPRSRHDLTSQGQAAAEPSLQSSY